MAKQNGSGISSEISRWQQHQKNQRRAHRGVRPDEHAPLSVTSRFHLITLHHSRSALALTHTARVNANALRRVGAYSDDGALFARQSVVGLFSVLKPLNI